MTNATYATPQVEDQEMGRVREIFDRALNALVDASTLAKEVEQVKSDLESLKSQVTHYRNTIANQDDQITRLRQDRDAARTAQYHAEDEVRHHATKLETINRENDSVNAANVRLNDRIAEVTKERDEAQFKLLELQESHAALSKKLDAIKGHMQSLFATAPEPQYPTALEPSVAGTVIGSTTPTPLAQGDYEAVVAEPKDTPVVEYGWQDPLPPTNPPEPTPAFPEDIKR